MSPTAGGRARSRPPEATTRGSRARDALDGHEESAGVLIYDRARVGVGDVPHKSFLALGAPAGTLAAPVWTIMKRREGLGRKWRSGGLTQTALQLETARRPCARARKISLFTNLYWRSRPKPAHGPGERQLGVQREYRVRHQEEAGP